MFVRPVRGDIFQVNVPDPLEHLLEGLIGILPCAEIVARIEVQSDRPGRQLPQEAPDVRAVLGKQCRFRLDQDLNSQLFREGKNRLQACAKVVLHLLPGHVAQRTARRNRDVPAPERRGKPQASQRVIDPDPASLLQGLDPGWKVIVFL